MLKTGRAAGLALYYAGLAIFWLSCLAWSPLASLLRPFVPRRHRAQLGQFMIMAGFRWFVWLMQATGAARCDLSALDALRDQGGLMIVANHRSLLDAVLLVSRLPRVACISKAVLWNNPFLGGGIRMAGYLRNDAALPLVRNGAARLRAGQQMLVFPEGTRGTEWPVGRFHGGFAVMARQAGVKVQTVFIESNTDYLGKAWPMLRKPDFPMLFRARLGPRLTVQGSTANFVADLEQLYRRELQPLDTLP